MSTPKRIQRRRTKGWRMPEGAIYVGRPSRWGNPYVVGETYITGGSLGPMTVPVPTYRDPGSYDFGITVQRVEGPAQAVAWFHGATTTWLQHNPAHLAPLRGRDLACWCPLACGMDVDLGWGEFGGPYDPCALPAGHDGHHDPSAAPFCHADVLLELANREAA